MAFHKHFLPAALAVALLCLPPVESERDQYEKGLPASHAVQPPPEATDTMLQVSVPQRPGSIKKETNTDSLSDVSRSETARTKRGFARWSGPQSQLAGYESFAMWKPPVYQLSRPYFIPIYGAPGRMPIYFPPQQLNINPGTPMDNPLPNRPFRGPSYLPPSSSTTEAPVTMEFPFRFNGDDDDEDDERPIWPDAPTTARRPNVNNIVPTRPPRPSAMPVPPLVHDISSGTNFLTAGSEESKNNPPSQAFGPSPEASPSILRSTVAAPSNCVWAIVSCCSAATSIVPDSCFEQRGCPGPFWGTSPCDSNFARAAVAQALNYYNQ